MSIAAFATAGWAFRHPDAADALLRPATPAASEHRLVVADEPDHALLDALRELGVPVRNAAVLDANAAPATAHHVRRFAEFWQRQHATGIGDFAFVTQNLLVHRFDPDAVRGAIELHRQGVIELRLAARDVRMSSGLIHHLARFALDDGDALHEHPLSIEAMFEQLRAAGFDLEAMNRCTYIESAHDGAAVSETWKLSPFCAALKQGNVETARALLNLASDARWNDAGRCRLVPRLVFEGKHPLATPLELAVRSGLVAFTAEIAKRIDPGSSADTIRSMQLMAEHGLADALDTVLARGADVNARAADGTTALSHAVMHRRYAAVDVLLDHGADPNAVDTRGRSLLQHALDDGDERMARRLSAASGLRLHATGDASYSALQHAIESGFDDVAARVVRHGADVRALFPNGCSALQVALDFNLPNTVKALLDEGADVDYSNHRGQRAIHIAAQRGDGESLALLLAHGSQVNFKRRYGMPAPLKLAVLSGAADAVKQLVAAGAYIDLRDGDAPVPLLTAALGRRAETAVSLASSLGYTDIVRLLKHPESCRPLIATEGDAACVDSARESSPLRDRVQRMLACIAPQTR